MFNKNLFPVIEASGTPYEVGYIHGSQAQKQIDVSVSTYKDMFLTYSGITWEAAQKYANTFIEAITGYDADIMEELRGIAAGSGYELTEILALNVRSEIVLQGGLIDGCTSFALLPEITEARETWLAQNWDWKKQQQNAYILLKIKQEKKPDINLFTEAGIVGKLGFNSSGIGVCLNALGSDKKVEGPVVPLHIVLRGILNSETLPDAIASVAKMNLSCCANFMTACADGSAVTVEAGPGDFDVLYPDDYWIAHTNHFTSNYWISRVHDTGKVSFPDTFIRYGRVKQLIKKVLANHKFGFQDIRSILSDHMGYPDSICRHEDIRDEEGKRMGTVFSVVMNLSRREMYITPGNPCESQHYLYKL